MKMVLTVLVDIPNLVVVKMEPLKLLMEKPLIVDVNILNMDVVVMNIPSKSML